MKAGALLRLVGAGLTLLAAAGCTAGGLNGDAGGPPGNTPVHLEGTTWQLVSFTTSDGPLPIPAAPLPTLTFEDGHYEFDAGCNPVFGEYDIEDGLPKIKRVIMHLVSCGDEPDGTAAMALENAVADSIDAWSAYRRTGDELTIDYDGGRLVFTRAAPNSAEEMVIQIHGATVAPLGEPTTLTFGRRGRRG